MSREKEMDSFSVVVFGDMQNQNDITRRIIRLAAGMRPDLCIVLGDLVGAGTETALWEEGARLLEPLRAVGEVAAVPGNHDYEGPGATGNFRRWFRGPGELTYTSLRRGGCRFILLDTMLGDEDTLECGLFSPDSSQAAWLADELEGARALAEPSFVFAHHPIFMSTEVYFSTSPTIRVDETGRELTVGHLLPILLQGGAQIYFAGHIHLYEKSRYQGMCFITSGATSFEFPNLREGGNQFGEVRLEKNHLVHLDLGGDVVRVRAIDEWEEVIDAWEEPLC